MVPEKHLTRIQGVNQMLQGGLNIIAAPIGALLLAWIAIVGILFIDIVTALFAIVPLIFMAIPQPQKAPPAAGEAESSMGQEIKAGFRYVWQRPGILMIMIMAAMINFLLTPAVSLVPLLVTEHFNGGPMQYATFEMGVGIGILVGGILLSIWGGFSKRIYTSLMGIIGIGVGVIAVGLAPSNLFVLAVAGIFFAGVMMPFANGSIQAIMQVIVAPEFQGRVFTLLGTVAMGMAPLGLIIAGPVADFLGVRFWFTLGGIVCLIMGIGALFVPTITHVEERHTLAPAEADMVAA
jgi:DHA3 family macrolide efflux protein-like MFS transporter